MVIAEAEPKHLLMKSASHISLFCAPPLIPTPGFITREREREEREGALVGVCLCVSESYPMSKPITVYRLRFCHSRSLSSLTDAPLGSSGLCFKVCALLSAWLHDSMCRNRILSRWVPLRTRSRQRGNFSVRRGAAEPRVSPWEKKKFERINWRPCACSDTPLPPRFAHFLPNPLGKKMQKSVRYNEGHALFLSVVARKEGTKRGFLSKKTAENSRWHEKFFALYQNVLFYFENEQSARPSGIYLLEGCTCERVPAPKMSTTGKEALEKQVRALSSASGDWMHRTPLLIRSHRDFSPDCTTFWNQFPDNFRDLFCSHTYTHTYTSLTQNLMLLSLWGHT